MELLETYQVPGWLDFVLTCFAAVPAGLLLGMFLGLLSFGIFGLLRLFRRLVSR